MRTIFNKKAAALLVVGGAALSGLTFRSSISVADVPIAHEVNSNGIVDVWSLAFGDALKDASAWSQGQVAAHSSDDEKFRELDAAVDAAVDELYRLAVDSDGAKRSQEMWLECMNYAWPDSPTLHREVDRLSSLSTSEATSRATDLLSQSAECERRSSASFNAAILGLAPKWLEANRELFNTYASTVLQYAARAEVEAALSDS
jgi:hypothetical protein